MLILTSWEKERNTTLDNQEDKHDGLIFNEVIPLCNDSATATIKSLSVCIIFFVIVE